MNMTNNTEANWNDFNDDESCFTTGLIPANTLAKCIMHIRAGGYNDESRNWTGGYAIRNPNTGAVYLHVEYTVMEGPHTKRKMWGNIGLYSLKSPSYALMGKSFIKKLILSSRNIDPKDVSPQAETARRIEYLKELDGLIFVGHIGIAKDIHGVDRNEIITPITCDHKDYIALMKHDLALPKAEGKHYSSVAPFKSPHWA